MKSIFGTYVWGHSFYANKIYSLMILSFFLCALSYPFIRYYETKKQNYKFLLFSYLLLLLTISCQFITVLIPSYLYSEASFIVADSFTKARLTAPGSVQMFLFPCLVFISFYKQKWFQNLFFYIAVTHFLILTCYYYPKFFIADIF